MATDVSRAFTTEEAALAEIDSLKSTFKLKLLECKRAVKEALLAEKALDKAKTKADTKRSTRNLTKLSRAEHECDSAINEALLERSRAKELLTRISDVYDETAAALMSEGKKSKAKKYTKVCDKYARCKEDDLDSIYAPLAKFVRDDVPSATSAMPEHPHGPTPPPAGSPPPFYFVPAYMDSAASSAINREEIKEAVKEVLDEQLSPFFERIEQRLAELIAASPISAPPSEEVEAPESAAETAPTEITDTEAAVVAPAIDAAVEPDAEEVAKCEEIAAKTKNLAELLDSVICELDGMGEKLTAVVEAQRSVNDMQRTLTREMQGMQVKQKLVNEEQMALVESEELILQQQKLVGEKQAELTEAQSAVIRGVEAIMEAQTSLDEAVKSSIQTQKGIIQSSAKSLDVQRELAERQSEIAQIQKQTLATQRKLTKKLKPQDSKIPPSQDGDEEDDT